MKYKFFALVVSFVLMFSISVFAATVDRSMPSRVDPSSTVTISLNINPEGTLTMFDLADFVPMSWTMGDWSVSGYSKSDVEFDSQAREYQSAIRNGLHWKFKTPLTSPITLTYTMTAPAATGSYDMIALWTYPGGFNSKTTSVNVATAPVVQPPAEQPQCATKYWFDNTNKNCDSKQFCGAYMYQGLYTFDTREDCLKNLPVTQTTLPSEQNKQTSPFVYVAILVVIIAAAALFINNKRSHHKLRN